jgi:hypothetical protein
MCVEAPANAANMFRVRLIIVGLNLAVHWTYYG